MTGGGVETLRLRVPLVVVVVVDCALSAGVLGVAFLWLVAMSELYSKTTAFRAYL